MVMGVAAADARMPDGDACWCLCLCLNFGHACSCCCCCSFRANFRPQVDHSLQRSQPLQVDQADPAHDICQLPFHISMLIPVTTVLTPTAFEVSMHFSCRFTDWQRWQWLHQQPFSERCLLAAVIIVRSLVCCPLWFAASCMCMFVWGGGARMFVGGGPHLTSLLGPDLLYCCTAGLVGSACCCIMPQLSSMPLQLLSTIFCSPGAGWCCVRGRSVSCQVVGDLLQNKYSCSNLLHCLFPCRAAMQRT
jgi:hypothetical protein